MNCFKHMKFLLFVFFIAINTLPTYAIGQFKDKIVLGNKESAIEVYFVSDWFCPSCRRTEPTIEELYPQIQSKVAFYFIDFPINKKSLNYTPYNLAFLIQDKPQYLTIRKALVDLVDEVDFPTDKEMVTIAENAHTQFKELSYTDVKAGLEYFNQIIDQYELTSTPTVLIINKNTQKLIKLEGWHKIYEKTILKAITNLSTDESD